ncbi:hypothetical protein F3J23_14110 [Chryseobacterium sp. Tr-659]|uniref:hypothetical protein n=1 Tax=Chryseobacterium sp. Tr-659 TaxID=2608340 RepID=UPI001422C55B|nr:hypothetical protein [Chryseobacterium sp. Tr-659]NIF06579.1 hypothetical protein [Chryseobacterium sp. Tr-659]
MRILFFLILLAKFNTMGAQKNASKDFQVITFEESKKYNIRNMKDHAFPDYNGATSLFIDDNTLFVFPNIDRGSCLIISKNKYEEMIANNSYPVLPENNTPYFLYKDLMNKEGFTKENMIKVLKDIGLDYNEDTFYTDAEKLVKTLSEDEKKKFVVPALYFIGEDLLKLCPEADWSFSKRWYFHPFNEPILAYDDHSFSFYYLNVLLERKLLEDKKMTFKSIYKKVEKYYIKESWFWEKH